MESFNEDERKFILQRALVVRMREYIGPDTPIFFDDELKFIDPSQYKKHFEKIPKKPIEEYIKRHTNMMEELAVRWYEKYKEFLSRK